jgi:hypothetical protein
MEFLDNVKELVSSYQQAEFTLLNKGVANEIGNDQTIVLAELLSRFQFHASDNTLDKDGSFYCTAEKMEQLTNFSYKRQLPIITKLVARGLIQVVHKKGNKRYFRIIIETVKALIMKCSKPVKKKENKPVEKPVPTPVEEPVDNQDQNIHIKNSRYTPKEYPDIPQREIPIYKSEAIKPKAIKPKYKRLVIKYIKDIKISSSLIDTQPEIPKEKKKEITIPTPFLESKISKPKMDTKHQLELEAFLSEKGFTKLLIKQTVHQFTVKGITEFKVSQLVTAFKNMIYYHNNIQSVGCPPIFFANGVRTVMPLHPATREPVSDKKQEPIPFYNWLEQGLSWEGQCG